MRRELADAGAGGARGVLLLTLLMIGGCAHRTAPEPQAEEWYRKPGLFASFDVDAPDLTLPNAYLLELACYIGDRGTFEVDRTLQAWGFDRRRDFRDLRTSTYGYVASNDELVLVTFGGTDFMNVRDLLSDADALQLIHDERYCVTPGARVHRGFRDSLNSVMDGVMAEVQRQAGPPPGGPEGGPTTGPTSRRIDGQGIAPPRKKLFIAGHSRGGAFAVLAAAALAKAGTGGIDTVPVLGGVYTFGQPRVGNGPFVEGMSALGVPLFRFIHRDDPIPGVPPAGLLPQRFGVSERLNGRLGYQHGGVAVHLRADGRVVKAAPDGPGIGTLGDPFAAGAGIGDHYQAGYHAAIYRALQDPQRVEEPRWRATVPSDGVDALPHPAR